MIHKALQQVDQLIIRNCWKSVRKLTDNSIEPISELSHVNFGSDLMELSSLILECGTDNPIEASEYVTYENQVERQILSISDLVNQIIIEEGVGNVDNESSDLSISEESDQIPLDEGIMHMKKCVLCMEQQDFSTASDIQRIS